MDFRLQREWGRFVHNARFGALGYGKVEDEVATRDRLLTDGSPLLYRSLMRGASIYDTFNLDEYEVEPTSTARELDVVDNPVESTPDHEDQST